MRIRDYRGEDLAGIEEIERASFSVPWTASSLRSAFEGDGAVGLVLCGERDTEICGYALSLLLFDDAQLLTIAVAAAHRGRGYGAALLEEMLRRLAEQRARRVTLEVRVSNRAAIALYRRFGFSPIAVRKNYYKLPTEDAYIMEYHNEHTCD